MILTPQEIRTCIDRHRGRHKYYLLSGYFDPVHPGHLAMLDAIPWCGCSAIVVVNGDGATRKKKGYSFMDANVRSQIMDHMKGVEYTCLWNEPDVARCLAIIQPDFFVNGGDRKEGNLNNTEEEVCREYGIEPLYGFGGTDKPYSSSNILKKYQNKVITDFILRTYNEPKEEKEGQPKEDY